MNTKYINYIFSVFAIILCLIWIYFLLFSREFMGNLSGTHKKIFVGFLLLYAIYRVHRLYTLIQKDKMNKK